jgi:hypothetical protein
MFDSTGRQMASYHLISEGTRRVNEQAITKSDALKVIIMFLSRFEPQNGDFVSNNSFTKNSEFNRAIELTFRGLSLMPGTLPVTMSDNSRQVRWLGQRISISHPGRIAG